jgi:hypothetical protein
MLVTVARAAGWSGERNNRDVSFGETHFTTSTRMPSMIRVEKVESKEITAVSEPEALKLLGQPISTPWYHPSSQRGTHVGVRREAVARQTFLTR